MSARNLYLAYQKGPSKEDILSNLNAAPSARPDSAGCISFVELSFERELRARTHYPGDFNEERLEFHCQSHDFNAMKVILALCLYRRLSQRFRGNYLCYDEQYVTYFYSFDRKLLVQSDKAKLFHMEMNIHGLPCELPYYCAKQEEISSCLAAFK